MMLERLRVCKQLGIVGLTVMIILATTGCWDRTEINDISLITATAYDLAPDGKIEYTTQIMLPSSTGTKSGTGSSESKKKSFITETATGIDLGDAEKNIQRRFPRRLFRGHRRVIVIGEELARHGIGDILDTVSRDPQNRLRTNILVAKGISGKDLLAVDYPLERVPAEAMREMLGIGLNLEASLRDFLIASSSEGIQPIGISMEPSASKDQFSVTGLAVFKDLKLAGFLDIEETEGYLWIAGKYANSIVAARVPDKDGTFRVNVKSDQAKIDFQIQGNKVKLIIHLKGEGAIYENTTRLDLTIPENIALAEQVIKKRIQDQVMHTVQVVQKDYRSDIFGFGSTIYEYNPKAWDKLKNNWDKLYPDAEVAVSVDFKIRMTGMSGQPLYLKKNEVQKK